MLGNITGMTLDIYLPKLVTSHDSSPKLVKESRSRKAAASRHNLP
jgi:hypothetical protein